LRDNPEPIVNQSRFVDRTGILVGLQVKPESYTPEFFSCVTKEKNLPSIDSKKKILEIKNSKSDIFEIYCLVI
jgi:hypothetical protein